MNSRMNTNKFPQMLWWSLICPTHATPIVQNHLLPATRYPLGYRLDEVAELGGLLCVLVVELKLRVWINDSPKNEFLWPNMTRALK